MNLTGQQLPDAPGDGGNYVDIFDAEKYVTGRAGATLAGAWTSTGWARSATALRFAVCPRWPR